MSTPRDVIAAALAVPLPCPACGSAEAGACRCEVPEGYSTVAARAELIEAALIEYGFLPHDERPMTTEETEQVAQWLAEQSRHPRYTQSDDGWGKLLQSEGDVQMAYGCAAQKSGQGGLEQLARARDHLIAVVAARRASEVEAS